MTRPVRCAACGLGRSTVRTGTLCAVCAPATRLDAGWMDQAACARHPHPEVFDPDATSTEQAEALATCARCPVIAACAAAADRLDARGVWGGRRRTG